MSMKSGKRSQLAEKMAGEITLSDSPGHALKKWRVNFEIAPGVLLHRLGVSPSVISDYEGGRRKSPGTAVVGKIVDSLLAIDEENGGRHIQKFSSMLFSGIDDDVIIDLHEYENPVALKDFSEVNWVYAPMRVNRPDHLWLHRRQQPERNHATLFR